MKLALNRTESSMMNLYGVLKSLHVLSVVFWVGGVSALWITTLRLARAGDYATVTRLQPVGMRYGQSVVGPASGIVLITGIWMAIIGKLFSQPFVIVGIVGITIHFFMGPTVVRRTWLELGRLLNEPNRDDAAVAATVGRIATVSWVYLLVMVLVIAAMVLKP